MEPHRNELRENENSIYIITDKLASGGQADTFLVKRENEEIIHVAKVQTDNDVDSYNKEIHSLNLLNKFHNPRIINLISSGTGTLFWNDQQINGQRYLILEYASKGELYNYLFYPGEGFGERYSKLLFYKILEGIKFCHDHGICHLDIKLDNIFLDNTYSPKIGDFGYSTENNNNLKIFRGTKDYIPPELWRFKPYDGFKADIFSLGATLIKLTFCVDGFEQAAIKDKLYRKIILQEYDEYWEHFDYKIKDISPEFKDLYINMILYNPQKRINFEEIIEHKWFNEIRAMSKQQREDLEKELTKEFEKRELKINGGSHQEMDYNPQENNDNNGGNRSVGESENIYFEKNLSPKECRPSIRNYNFIKIKGIINPKDFMNKICNKIENKYGDSCEIEINKFKAKFNITFDEEGNEEEEEEKELPKNVKEKLKKLGIDDIIENKIKEDNLIIQIKLFRTLDGHLLRFVKKKGTKKNFLEKFKEIAQLLKN